MLKPERRGYQENAIIEVTKRWNDGAKSVCLVSPTGSGKTYMGARFCSGHTLWLAHRRELVEQACKMLRQLHGAEHVGVIAPGYPHEPHKRIQVATVQSIIDKKLPNVELLVLDECHHYTLANTWGTKSMSYDAETSDDVISLNEVAVRFPNTRRLGLTAWPQRRDGESLKDLFSHMVVAVQHSELLKAGKIVPWAIYSPTVQQSGSLAMTPIEAWIQLGGGLRTFAYFERVDQAETWAAVFNKHGVHARVIHAGTPIGERKESLSGLKSGAVLVVTNVYTMTEGVDIPEVQVILLAHRFQHIGGFLQVCGRASRAANGKAMAILIDLYGSSLLHGNPSDDLEYSLDGSGIRRVATEAVERPQERPEYVPPTFSGDEIRYLAGISNAPPATHTPQRFLEPIDSKLTERLRRRAARKGGQSMARLVQRVTGGLSQ